MLTLWYQQRTLTDGQGKYAFRVTPQPERMRWQVVFAGETVQLAVKEGEPVVEQDFVVGAQPRGDGQGQRKAASAR
jgi:hypothetical protein